MSVKISGEYLGDKQCRLLHEPSGATLVTDAPKDNSGKGRDFSPTDLAGASMASCMMTIMAILAEREQVDLSGSSFSVVKHMNESPRRIAKLEVTFHLPQHCEESFRR